MTATILLLALEQVAERAELLRGARNGRHVLGRRLVGAAHGERQPALLVVDREDARLDLLALADDLLRMIDAATRAELADVNEALDAGGNLDERTERLEARDDAFDARALVQALRRVVP